MRRALLFLAVVFMTACSDDPSGFGDSQITGTYNLVTIEGEPLPATLIQSPEFEFTWVSSSLLIALNGTFREIDTIRIREGNETTIEVDTTTGTWNQPNNSAIRLTAVVEGETQHIDGHWTSLNELQFESDGVTFVWRK